MLQIVESLHPTPLRFMADKISSFFEPGLISQLIEINGTPTCTLSNGTRPFGVIGGQVDKYGLVPIWFDSMILRTDKYELLANYAAGNPLYVSNLSRLTTVKPFEEAQLVGHVISPPAGRDRPWIELNWI